MKTYTLTWNILDLADKSIGQPVTNNFKFFKDNFGGNATPLFYDRNGQSKPAKPRGWNAEIKVQAQDHDGTVHTVNFEFKPNHKMFLKEFMDGITKHWLDECDRDLNGMDCISATAIARCKAQ